MRVPAAPRNKADMHNFLAFRIRRFHLLQELGVDRVAFLFQHVEGKGDIGRSHVGAVDEARLRTQPEAVVQLVGEDAHGLREQTVDGIGFIAVCGHQRVEGGRHAGCAVALPSVDIERVEGVEVLVAARSGDLQRQQAAGRRLGIYVREMREVRRQGELAERRQAMRLDEIVGKRGERARNQRRQRATRAGLQRRPAGQCYSHRIVRLMARGLTRCIAPERSSPASAAKTRRL